MELVGRRLVITPGCAAVDSRSTLIPQTLSCQLTLLDQMEGSNSTLRLYSYCAGLMRHAPQSADRMIEAHLTILQLQAMQLSQQLNCCFGDGMRLSHHWPLRVTSPKCRAHFTHRQALADSGVYPGCAVSGTLSHVSSSASHFPGRQPQLHLVSYGADVLFYFR